VLALLIAQPAHGYDVCKRFDERFGSLLNVGSSRIYQVIRELEERGLLEPMPPDEFERRGAGPSASASRRAARRFPYRATPAGARLHREWLAAEMRSSPVRAELQRRLLSVTVNDTSVILDLVHRYEKACVEEAAEVALLAAPTGGGSRAEIIAGLREQLMAEERRLVIEARLRWVVFARRGTQEAARQIARLEGR
jgi:Transcriptional regulator PadR-like family